ncbi:hypothetical protein II810_04995 [bacterium]|nr:hypothetical protein [bacterium]
MNTLQTFLNKALNVPFPIKLIMYKILSSEFSECVGMNQVEAFLNYVPIITFKGDTELNDKKCGLDGNTYNFLNYIKQGYTLPEICVNTFLSLQEAVTIFVFCQNQGFVDIAQDDIQNIADYICGKNTKDVPEIVKELKNEAQKRLILDYGVLPKIVNDKTLNGEQTVKGDDNSEVLRLKSENEKLKEKLNRLYEVIHGVIK